MARAAAFCCSGSDQLTAYATLSQPSRVGDSKCGASQTHNGTHERGTSRPGPAMPASRRCAPVRPFLLRFTTWRFPTARLAAGSTRKCRPTVHSRRCCWCSSAPLTKPGSWIWVDSSSRCNEVTHVRASVRGDAKLGQTTPVMDGAAVPGGLGRLPPTHRLQPLGV